MMMIIHLHNALLLFGLFADFYCCSSCCYCCCAPTRCWRCCVLTSFRHCQPRYCSCRFHCSCHRHSNCWRSCCWWIYCCYRKRSCHSCVRSLPHFRRNQMMASAMETHQCLRLGCGNGLCSCLC